MATSTSSRLGLPAHPPRARVRPAIHVNAGPLSVLQIFRSVVDDPVPRCAHPALRPGGSSRSLGAAAADAVIIDPPELRSARRSSVAQLAGIGARLARAREGSE
jgi:hypothetical protein